jgi:hypothetical protein
MPNPWVDFVRAYAKDNNISYGCAISEAGVAYRSMKKGGNPKQEKEERGMMIGEDFDARNIAKKKKISLPPLQSEREISLYSFKKDDLSKILKAQKVNGISKMKKDDMIKNILEMEGLEEGVKWGDKEWLLRDLKEAKRCNDPKDSINGLQSLQYKLNKQKEKQEKIRSLKTSNIEEARDRQRRIRLAQNNIERITEDIKKCNSLLSRDLEKEYRGTGS